MIGGMASSRCGRRKVAEGPALGNRREILTMRDKNANRGAQTVDEPLGERWRMALVGAAVGALAWAVIEAAEAGWFGDPSAMVLLALVLTAGMSTLALSGPIPFRQAVPRALGLAVFTAGLVWLAGLRHAEGIFGSGLSVLAAVVVATLPVPFLQVQAQGNWRDYPALFTAAWAIVVRLVAAAAFVGLFWAVVFLSDQVLEIVGLTVISDLLEYWIVSSVLSGAVFGLGMAAVHEQADTLSPYPVLRLFRLLLPVVLAVMLVFLAALPFRGLNGLFNGLSPTLLLLTMIAAGVSLTSITVAQTDAEATQSRLLNRAAKGMALILPVMAALAAHAVWQRIGQHGWTPERLFAALTCGIALGYGLTYALAVLRGRDWQERIRQANVGVALLAIVLAALWLTPILNAERLSAQDQLARFDAGTTAVADLDVEAIRRWGYPGQAVLDVLAERSKETGQEALAARLAGTNDQDSNRRLEAAAELAAIIPVQPAGATGTRDMLISAAEDFQISDWTGLCSREFVSGRPGCLMVVADMLPSQPGEEAILLLLRTDTYVDLLGLYLDDAGRLATRPVQRVDGRLLTMDDMVTLVDTWRTAPPPLTPAPVNQLGTGDAGLVFLP
jgi:hypothetical protein